MPFKRIVQNIIRPRAGQLRNTYTPVINRCLVPPVPLVGILRSLQQVLCCTNCQNKQKQYNCLLIHPRDTGDWVSCKSSFYCSTLERMLGGTLVSGETFIGAQSIASFSRSPPLKYPFQGHHPSNTLLPLQIID